MKIAFLTNHLNPGGITTYLISLAKGLKEKGHTVKVISRGGANERELEKLGIEHIFLNLFAKSEISLKIILSKRRLSSIFKKDKIDLMHPQTRITRVLAQYVNNKLKIPFVSTAHGFYKKRLSHKIFPCWGKKIIAVSRAVKEDLINKFGLKNENIRVIYNGIEIERFKPQEEKEINQMRNIFGLGTGPIIGIISRLSEIKGHFYLLKAMSYILKKFPQAQLLIVGSGQRKEYLMKLIKEFKIEKNVILISSFSDTPLLFSLMDVFTLPSLEEGLGLVIIEAMASGVPTVATRVGGIPELIQDGENGLLVSPQNYLELGEAICKILENQELRNSLILNGKKTVIEKFNLERMVNETLELYREIT